MSVTEEDVNRMHYRLTVSAMATVLSFSFSRAATSFAIAPSFSGGNELEAMMFRETREPTLVDDF